MAKEKAKAAPAAKTTAAKAAPAPPAAPAAPAKKAAAKDTKDKEKAGKSMSKSQFIQAVSEHAKLEKKEVASVMEAVNAVIVKELGKKGPGVVALPGLFKLKAKRVDAVKGGKEVPNRFKPGEMTTTKDKPAHTKVSVRPLKGLKEMLK